ncbi:hypothetical protein [Nonomuraea sediminis]|uniref:hypothetical protein n=1 Tax=Nonomuraea sediminis TaxID=2835864 RepID=UPI001BDDA601|nr:hypothetical protein [Nonomuraea sediminis]
MSRLAGDLHYAHPRTRASAWAIEWGLPGCEVPREHVIEWTCSCRTIRYELIAGAGAMWIRRFEGDQVLETHRTAAALIRELWADLLDGDAA